MPSQDIIEPQNFAELMQSMPAVWTGLLAVGLLVGLVLWAFGGRLAKKGVILTGFVVGGLGAAALAMGMSSPPAEVVAYAPQVAEAAGEAFRNSGSNAAGAGSGLWVLAIGIGGALAGGLLAWLLFRFWMAASAALVLAAVVPLSAMIWAGNGPTLSAVQNTQNVTLNALGAGQSDPAADSLREWKSRVRIPGSNSRPDPRNNPSDFSDHDPEQPSAGTTTRFDRQAFFADLQSVWQQQIADVKTWWADLEPGPRRFLMGGAIVGGGVGLVLGMVLPLLAAAIQSALVGSMLILFSGQTLLLKFAPAAAGILPHTWRGILLSLGLITLLGILIQWSLRKRKADE